MIESTLIEKIKQNKYLAIIIPLLNDPRKLIELFSIIGEQHVCDPLFTKILFEHLDNKLTVDKAKFF